MKKILMLVVALMAVGSGEVEAQNETIDEMLQLFSSAQDIDELVRQGDIYMKRGLIRRNNLTPYTGEAIWYNSKEDKSSVRVRGRMRDGVWQCTDFLEVFDEDEEFLRRTFGSVTAYNEYGREAGEYDEWAKFVVDESGERPPPCDKTEF